ncbi:YVTN family beta-propeller protein [Bradyrhizobium diazoefficiens]
MRMRSGTAVAGVAALAVAGMALTAAFEPVWAHGPTRQKVRESIEINAAPAKVWAVIGNFQDMSWLPPVTKTEGEKGNEIGATRRLTLTGGATVDEELYKFDAAAMTYSYRITAVDVKVLPVTNYSSTLTVTPSADGKGATLEWAGAFYRGFSQQRSAAGAERRGRQDCGERALQGRPRGTEEEDRERKLTVRVLVLAALAASLTCLGSASAEEAFVTNQLSDDLMVVDLATARAVATIPIGGKPAGIAVSADGRFAYVTSPDAKAVTVVDAATRQVAGRIEVGGGPLGIAVAPDGRTVYVADWYAAAVRVIDAASRSVRASIAVGASPSGLAVTPDGKLLLSADRDDDSVSVVDTATRARKAVIKVGTRPFGVTIDTDGKRAYTANVGSNNISVIDIATGSEIGRVPVGMRPYAVALAQGRGFVTDQYGGTVSVFDLATLKPVKRINVGDYPEGINATADGKRIIVACWESNTLDIIDTTELKVIGEVKTGDGPRAFGAFLRRTE